MSRTKRFNPKYSYFRTPRCKGDYMTEQDAIEQLEEEGFHSNRVSQKANHTGEKATPNSYDDIDFSCRGEIKYDKNKK